MINLILFIWDPSLRYEGALACSGFYSFHFHNCHSSFKPLDGVRMTFLRYIKKQLSQNKWHLLTARAGQSWRWPSTAGGPVPRLWRVRSLSPPCHINQEHYFSIAQQGHQITLSEWVSQFIKLSVICVMHFTCSCPSIAPTPGQSPGRRIDWF